MKKMYLLLIILNNIASTILIINYFLIELNALKIFFIISAVILYLSLTIAIIKRGQIITSLDMITISIYMLFIIFMFLFSIYYQNQNPYTFSMLYFSSFLFIPSILFNVYNLFKSRKEEV